ncbi:hypothetical protein [Novosphingobium sp. RL4]|uniref:hypothetical protein n=1 Tax=Novosphingobium sp. RL4 TaxID=3109595 RepID=UPI002D76F313|nr:hypothetical protein [Novosphingobium sp. RL4]WRT95156.1 hypothetical protein U9J33_23495 [Novosphingobium sp. RL4]
MAHSRNCIALYVAAAAISGCTVIGNGHNSVVLGELPQDPDYPRYPGREFQGLLRSPDGPPIIPGKGTITEEYAGWTAYRATHAGTLDSAQLDLIVRDLNVTPSLDPLNIETNNAADVAKIMADSTTSADQKGQLVERFRNNYRRMPENYLPMVPRQEFRDFGDGSGEQQVTAYHWFPKVALDLTGQLQTVGSSDRFEYLAVAVTLVNEREPGTSTPLPVTFVNFAPKAADLFDFTLGTFKQTASMTGKASIGGSASSKTTSGSSQTNTGTGTSSTETKGSETNAGSTNGASVSLTVSDELTRDLRSSIDTRSAGITNDGKTFVIALRSNEQRRISGTYNYAVMLDIAPKISKVKLANGSIVVVSDTPTRQIWADVRIIGVIRHVAKMGKTGTFKRVPEPTNDAVFNEVLVRQKRVLLWELHQDALIDSLPAPSNLIVYTNHDSATFSVIAADTRKILARGKGRETSLPLKDGQDVDIEFDPIILAGNAPSVLIAAPIRHVKLGAEPAKLVGTYLLQATAAKEKKNGK